MLLSIIFLLMSVNVQISGKVKKRIITSQKYSKYRLKLTVVNGEPVEPRRVPYLVSLKEPLAQKGDMKYWGNLCGGSIITADTILTAAHCFEQDSFLYLKRPNVLRAVSGSLQTDLEHVGTSGTTESGVQWRKLEKVAIHPNFHFPDDDIAAAFVDYPWDFKTGAQPIALPSVTTDELGSCYTAGYGKVGHNQNDKISDVLLIAKIEPMTRHMCSIVWNLNMDTFICTNSKFSDVSNGDSGSPLSCESVMERTGPVLSGLVSGKNYDKTTLFTRISEYRSWIDSNFSTTFESSRAAKPFSFMCIPVTALLLYFKNLIT